MNAASQCDTHPLQLQELCPRSSRQPWVQDQNNTPFSLVEESGESLFCDSLFQGSFGAFLRRTHFLGCTVLQRTGWRSPWEDTVQPQLFRGPHISPASAKGEQARALLFPWGKVRSPEDQENVPAVARYAEDTACKVWHYLELPRCWRLPARVCHLAAAQPRAERGTGKQ